MLKISITLTDQEIEWLKANETVGDLIDYNKPSRKQIENAVHELIRHILKHSIKIDGKEDRDVDKIHGDINIPKEISEGSGS